MRTIEYRGTLLARSSIAHGGKESGTAHLFRRETFVLPDGRCLPSVPVISGGVVRGSLRRYAAKMTQAAITDGDPLPFPAVHALRTGGALRETRSSGEVLTGEKQAKLRDLIPMLSLFGLSAGGRIMSGRLIVDKPLPVTTETMFLHDHYQVALGDTYQPPSIWQTLQRETYTRFADVNDASAQPYIDDTAEAEREIPKGSGTMLWTQETIPPGTRLFHSLALEEATPVEVAFFDDLVARWSRSAQIGGQRARGLGRVQPEYTRTCRDIIGDEAIDEPAASWREAIADRRDEVKEVLGWL